MAKNLCSKQMNIHASSYTDHHRECSHFLCENGQAESERTVSSEKRQWCGSSRSRPHESFCAAGFSQPTPERALVRVPGMAVVMARMEPAFINQAGSAPECTIINKIIDNTAFVGFIDRC